MKPILCFALYWCLFVTAVAQQYDIPFIEHRVTDYTRILTAEQIQSLERKLERFEEASSNQIVVLMVNSLRDMTIEEYALKVAERNKLGKQGKDNGILLMIAKDDRELRFEVGYGLEGRMPDAICNQIIRTVIIPFLRNERYYEGISAGVDAAIAATRGEFKADEKEEQNRGMTLFAMFIIILLMFIFSTPFRSKRRTVGSGGYWSGLGGGGGFGGGGFSGGGGSFGGGGASGKW